tara:strand:- start:356 stop:790 length:435 start_codon:yes stop_codon:yes gene_type:complete
MKISVKQGRLMAFMVAMVLIVGIFIIGKMLGYGSAKNLYLLEGYDVVEGAEHTEDEQDEGTMEDFDVSANLVKGDSKIPPSPPPTAGPPVGAVAALAKIPSEKLRGEPTEPTEPDGDGFTCGKNKLLTSSVSGYDESESKLTPF